MRTSSKPSATAPTSARHAPSPSVRRLRLQVSPAGHAPGFMSFVIPYWCAGCGISYGPNAVRSTPYRSYESSIHYACSVCPRLSAPGVFRKSR
ncbi:hypothetical protein J2S42_000426 [Catenuloplanes indicus]|uniref:Uncharacterized protein n=1 Tax=Catenuloplanes indicus TaxID=137267 RepID=A0AAE3VV22_9ACTN|nr:hypothetical protein [Catenuloplanes indicus]